MATHSWPKIKIGTGSDFNRYLANLPLLDSKNLTLGDDKSEDQSMDQIQKLDTIHDFGGSRGNNLATDTITRIKDALISIGNFSSDSNYSYNQMIYYHILKYSFPQTAQWCQPILNLKSQWVSSFSYPGAGAQPRVVDDIEGYCLLLSLKAHRIKKGNYSDFLCCSYESNVASLQDVKQQMRNFFQTRTDAEGTGKINFLVDTPGNLTKVLKSDPALNDFAYVILQESAHDSAKGKPTTLHGGIIINEAYGGNGFTEVYGQTRSYTPGIGDEIIGDTGRFESNFNIHFNGLQFYPTKDSFITNVMYEKPGTAAVPVDCILNSLVHPTNVPQITKAVGAFVKTNDLKLKNSSKQVLDNNLGTDAFYDNFSSMPYNYTQANANALDLNFTKKRGGDGLQGRSCQYTNNSANGINCWKKHNSTQIIQGVEQGLYKNTIYTIKNLILVTIDRVLFSYCVKHEIPAVYSGTKYFVFFNPPKPPNAAVAAAPVSVPVPAVPVSVPVPAAPVSASSVPVQDVPASASDNPTVKVKGKKTGGMSGYVNQKGGVLDKVATKYFSEIPYNLLRLLPRIVNSKRQIEGTRGTNHTYMHLEISLSRIRDDEVQTVYANNKSCLYDSSYVREKQEQGNDFIFNQENYIINIKRGHCTLKNNGRIFDNFVFNYLKNGVIINFTFNTVFIFSLMNINGYLTRGKIEEIISILIPSEYLHNPKPPTLIPAKKLEFKGNYELHKQNVTNFVNELLDLPEDEQYADFVEDRYDGSEVAAKSKGKGKGRVDEDSDYKGSSGNVEPFSMVLRKRSQLPPSGGIAQSEYNSYDDDEDEDDQRGGLGPDKIPLLDLYYKLFFERDVSLDSSKLILNNFATIISYLNLFSRYEVLLCCDPEEYYQSFNTDDGIEITNKLQMYIMFKMLLDDFMAKKDKVCYGLLEHFIGSGDVAKNYFFAQDDLQSLIIYLFCDYKNLDTSADVRISSISGLNTNPVYAETNRYFSEELFPRVSQKVREIETYLSSGNTAENDTREFITRYLSTYGFMNMATDFADSIIPPEPAPAPVAAPISVSGTGAASEDEVRRQMEARRQQFQLEAEQIAREQAAIKQKKYEAARLPQPTRTYHSTTEKAFSTNMRTGLTNVGGFHSLKRNKLRKNKTRKNKRNLKKVTRRPRKNNRKTRKH
jgi:hypothetical protein